MDIKKKIQKLIGKKVVIEPIADKSIYTNREKSHAGGSLVDSNLLIVTNTDIPQEVINCIKENEKATVAVIKKSNPFTKEEILKAGENLLGPFLHIINIYKNDSTESMLNQDNLYQETDEMYEIYQLLQVEVDYLVLLNQYATICSAYISNDSQYSKVIEKSTDLCFRGLGEAMANHSVINNGIVASPSVPMSDIINTAVYMSSKYGQILAGEVLHLKG